MNFIKLNTFHLLLSKAKQAQNICNNVKMGKKQRNKCRVEQKCNNLYPLSDNALWVSPKKVLPSYINVPAYNFSIN